MGSTVTTGKLAAAFKSAENKTVYVLFEETYEKNCYPHTPHWSCLLIGTLEDAVKRIFLHASTCEGGMLQNRNGHLTPEGYIAGWMKELSAPVDMNNEKIEIYVKHGFGVPIPDERLEDAEAALLAIGRKDIAEMLRKKERVSLKLHDDAAVFLALYGASCMSPWRVLKYNMALTHLGRNALLGYNPATVATPEISYPKAMKVDRDVRLLQSPDGSWHCAGWEYSVIGNYICSLWESELREPGSFRKRIKGYRDAIQAAPMIPQGVKVVVNMNAPMDEYRKISALQFAANNPVTLTPSGFEVMVTEENQYSLTAFHENAIWQIPQTEAAAANEQLSLLVA